VEFSGVATTQRIFILGSARSGTSITYVALRRGLRLQGKGESHVLPIFQRMLHQFHLYRLSFDVATEVLATRLDTDELRRCLAEFIRDFYARHYPSGRWLDKTPGGESIIGIPLIREVFPDAKIIILKRNGIEVAQSFRSKFNTDLHAAFQAWTHCMGIIAKAVVEHPDCLVLDQFDIANAPDRTAGILCRFLGEPDRSAAVASQFVSNTLDRHTAHDWSRRLTLADMDWTEDEKARFIEICGPMMQHFNYRL
jgi:hypothetical protein